METRYKYAQLTFEDGMTYFAEYPQPTSMETIRAVFDRNSRLVEMLTIDTENNVMRQDFRGLKAINDYAGTRLEKLFEFQRTMLPPTIPKRKAIKVQVEVIEEKKEAGLA